MSTDRILSISAILIAFCAVCVSIWQGAATREHNRLSLAPFITSAPMLTGIDEKNGIYVSNDGTGTAFIKKAYVIANGKPFDLTKNSWPKIYKHLSIKNLCHSESWFKVGAALKSGESIKILAPTKSPKDPECPIQFIKLLAASELDLYLVYESIYQEEYQYKQRIGLDRQDIEIYRDLFHF